MRCIKKVTYSPSHVGMVGSVGVLGAVVAQEGRRWSAKAGAARRQRMQEALGSLGLAWPYKQR